MELVFRFAINLCSGIWWLMPFLFVFFLLAAIREIVHDGKNDLKYGLAAACSLLILCFAFLYCS